MIGTVTVVNKRTHRGPATYIGRGSVFGNPFKLTDHTREESIAKYEQLFYSTMLRDPKVIKELYALVERLISGEHIFLACYCKPLACHGDVLKEYIDNVINRYLDHITE